MAIMEVETKVKVYEENGEEVSANSDKKLTIKSHDHDGSMVVLSCGDVEVSVVGSDLKKAVDNAQNVR